MITIIHLFRIMFARINFETRILGIQGGQSLVKKKMNVGKKVPCLRDEINVSLFLIGYYRKFSNISNVTSFPPNFPGFDNWTSYMSNQI